MESIHFPIKDKWIPPSMEGLIFLVDTIIERMKAGKAVICHCNGGKGRTGTGSIIFIIIIATAIICLASYDECSDIRI
jgi:protein-tyrosine phosphatase